MAILASGAWLVLSIYESCLCCRIEPPEILGEYPAKSLVFIAMLCSLVCMHIYWFVLIARIAWTSVATGQTKDTREDDD